MPLTAITKNSTVSIGLVITLAGVIWQQAQKSKQVDVNSASIQYMSQHYDAKFDLIISKLAAIDVIKAQLDDLRKPIVNTQFNVKHVNRILNERSHDRASNDKACLKDSYSMNELGE